MKPEDCGENQEPESTERKIRVFGGSAPQGWVAIEDEEEVVRLEKTPPKVRNSVEDMEPAGPEPVRRRRKGESRLRQRHLTLAMAGAVGILVVLGVIALIQRNDSPPGTTLPFEGVGIERDIDESAANQLSKKAGHYLDRARQKVRWYLAAKEVGDVLPIVRDRGRWLSLLEKRWRPLRMEEREVDQLRMVIFGDDRKAWFSLVGEDEEGQGVQLIFVPRGNEVELDWAASFGVGDVPFSRLSDLELEKEVSMRVMAAPDHHFTQGFSEQEYLCFKLEDQYGNTWVWGYTKVGSPAGNQLSKILVTNSAILEGKEEVGVILNLRKTESCGNRQFEIGDLLAEHWVEWETD